MDDSLANHVRVGVRPMGVVRDLVSNSHYLFVLSVMDRPPSPHYGPLPEHLGIQIHEQSRGSGPRCSPDELCRRLAETIWEGALEGGFVDEDDA